mmetsp:Transcript_22326/g.68728  ORF Transcript_22326/g.68728 Transcript_22326/m.68728 type:complete len:116 (-) Transcript_22326:46-393(-)
MPLVLLFHLFLVLSFASPVLVSCFGSSPREATPRRPSPRRFFGFGGGIIHFVSSKHPSHHCLVSLAQQQLPTFRSPHRVPPTSGKELVTFISSSLGSPSQRPPSASLRRAYSSIP